MLNNIQLKRSLAPGLSLIFDMDGVIVDSNPVHRTAWAAFNGRFGLETTEEMLQGMYGKRNDEIVRDFFGIGLSPEEIISRGAGKEALYREMVDGRIEEILVPGVRQFLECHRDTPMAVATNGEPANVDLILDQTGLRPYFRAVVNGEQVKNPKPDPEIYYQAAGLLETSPANCIVFEDSSSGVEAARAAGMRVVLLCTTHVYLPGTSICVDNFKSGELNAWVAAQRRVD